MTPRTLAIVARVRAMQPGETFAQIGAEFGVTRERVRQIAKQHCDITGRVDLVNARHEQLADKVLPLWFAAELTETEIKRRCVCSESTLKAILDEADITPAMRRARMSLLIAQGRHKKYGTHEKAAKARELREAGMTYESIGENIGTWPAQARNLVLMLGPDPLGRGCPFYSRSGAA